MNPNTVINIMTLEPYHGYIPDLRYYRRVHEVMETACFMNDADKLQALIDKGLHIPHCDPTLLIVAVKEGSFDCVKLLIEHGMNPFVKDDEGRNILKIAREYKYEKIRKYLCWITVDGKNIDQTTEYTSDKPRRSTKKEKVNDTDKQDTNFVISKLMKLAINGDMASFVDYIDEIDLAIHQDSDVWKYGMSNILSLLCFNNEFVFAEYVLTKFPYIDVNQVHTKGSCSYNPLAASAISGNTNMMILLIQYGAEFIPELDVMKKIYNPEAAKLLINSGMMDRDLYDAIHLDD